MGGIKLITVSLKSFKIISDTQGSRKMPFYSKLAQNDYIIQIFNNK